MDNDEQMTMVIATGIERLWPNLARRAYEECDNRDKLYSSCSKEQLCDYEELIILMWVTETTLN